MKISPSVKKALQGFAIIQSLHSGVDWKYGGLSFTMFVNSRAPHWQVPFASMLKSLAYTRTVIFTLYLKMSRSGWGGARIAPTRGSWRFHKSQATFFFLSALKQNGRVKRRVPRFHKVIWCEETRLRKVCFRDQRSETRRRMERGFQQLLSTGQSLIILKGLLALAAWKADLGAKTK